VPISPTVYSAASSFVFQQVERPETPFMEILVTEATGLNVLITRPMERVAHADQAWWQSARNGGIAGLGLAPVQLDPESNSPALGMALPIVDPDTKEVLGVVRGLVRLNDLQRRISQKAVSVDADIRVFMRDGRLVADTVSNHAPALILSEAGNVLRQNDALAVKALAAAPGMEGAGYLMAMAERARHCGLFTHGRQRVLRSARAGGGFQGR